MSGRILIERHIAIPMRDGTHLCGDIYRPYSAHSPVPAILVRLPYNKNIASLREEAIDFLRAVDAGYAVIFQDTRGRFESEGVFYPFVTEGQDGYDTIEWIARQPWCSGSVGMAGLSYFAATQLLAAIEQPPHLKAIVPSITNDEYYHGWAYQGGAFQLGFVLLWILLYLGPDTARRLATAGTTSVNRELLLASDNLVQECLKLPLSDHPLLANGVAPYFFDWLAHECNDDYWQAIAVNRRYERILVPALHFGGWYDLFLGGTIGNFVELQKKAGTSFARTGQRMVIGPWAHGNLTGMFPDYSYGIFSSINAYDYNQAQLDFFDCYLKDGHMTLDDKAAVEIFVMGENEWRTETDWPLSRTQYTPWYLNSNGKASSLSGSLTPEIPNDDAADTYLYDPRNPAPTVGGANFLPAMNLGANAGPRDHRVVEEREDVLTYTSPCLASPMEVTGHVKLILFASTSAKDTDFVAKLCDVHPDGVSRILTEGILRIRFREGYEQPILATPGEIYRLEIDLGATSNLFLEGHRLRVVITSSSFPRFDRNLNTGNSLGQDGYDDIHIARQTVYHNQRHSSHIVLPVIPLA